MMKGPRPMPTRAPDPDRQEGDGHFIYPASREKFVDDMPPKDSLAGSGQLIAPKGMFRLVGVDVFSGPFEDFLIGDYENRADAVRECSAKGKKMSPAYVYDDRGRMIFSAGKP